MDRLEKRKDNHFQNDRSFSPNNNNNLPYNYLIDEGIMKQMGYLMIKTYFNYKKIQSDITSNDKKSIDSPSIELG